jgi:hypothetical protein
LGDLPITTSYALSSNNSDTVDGTHMGILSNNFLLKYNSVQSHIQNSRVWDDGDMIYVNGPLSCSTVFVEDSIHVSGPLTHIRGSTSGEIVCSMPFQGNSFKKVIIYLNDLNGIACYDFPVPFTHVSYAVVGNGILSLSKTGVTMSYDGTSMAVIEGF